MIDTLIKENRKCALCGLENKKVLSEEDGFELVRCSDCGYLYTRNPIEVNSKLKYYNLMARSSTDSRKNLNTAHYTLANQIKSCFLYSNVLKHIINLYPSGKINLFDVGCSGGLFLLSAQVVEDAFNIEKPSRFNCIGLAFDTNEKKDTIYYTGCEAYMLNEVPDKYYNSADCVTLLNVLEHVNDPNSLLTSISNILKDDGLLVLDLPNNQIVKIRGKLTGKYPGLALHEHINHFTPYSLNLLLRKNGYFLIKKIPGLLRGGSGFGKEVSYLFRIKYSLYYILYLMSRGKIYLFPHYTSIYKKLNES